MIAVRIESHILILNFLNENCSVFGDTERYNAENVVSFVIDSSPLVAKDLENFDKFSLMTNSSDFESLRVFSLDSNAYKVYPVEHRMYFFGHLAFSWLFQLIGDSKNRLSFCSKTFASFKCIDRDF